MIAALFVHEGGAYSGLPDVDPWPESRDARKYAGPYPVVAHPPCARWCQLAGLVQARYGYAVGDDEGCFESALNSVRAFGGVLEHPAYSKAWERFDLPIPDRSGWTRSMFDAGLSCHVEQGRYGHPARKATWLYAVAPTLPELRWGRSTNSGEALVNWCGNRPKAKYTIVGGIRREGDARRRIGKKAAAATPPAFRDVLLSIARSCLQVAQGCEGVGA